MTVEELRADLEAARAELAEAIRSMAERWEDPCLPSEAPQVRGGPQEETWTPREAMQHAVVGQLSHALMVASAVFDLPDAESALAALDRISRATDDVLADVGDGHLARPVAAMASRRAYVGQLGLPQSGDVDAALRLFAGHLRDHARQLQKAAQG